MKANASLLAAAMLLAGLSVIGHAEAAESAMQRDAANPSVHSHHVRMVSRQDATVPNGSTENAVTVRSPGSHNDGYRTSQGWWKDD